MTPQIRWHGLAESGWVSRSEQTDNRCRRGSRLVPLAMALFKPLGTKTVAFYRLTALTFDQAYYALDRRPINSVYLLLLPAYGMS